MMGKSKNSVKENCRFAGCSLGAIFKQLHIQILGYLNPVVPSEHGCGQHCPDFKFHPKKNLCVNSTEDFLALLDVIMPKNVRALH